MRHECGVMRWDIPYRQKAFELIHEDSLVHIIEIRAKLNF
jgi:hypothetical protein